MEQAIHTAAIWILSGLVLGSWVYCFLQVLAVRSFRAVKLPARRDPPEPVSILKPLHGVDEGLEINLRTFFTQDHPQFEILFAAREASDPCWDVVERLRQEFPDVNVLDQAVAADNKRGGQAVNAQPG